MKKSLPFLLVTLFLMIPAIAGAQGCDGAGNCYIRAGASGSGNGSSWTNAYTGFGTNAGQGLVNPASMTRGVTYWIAAGSYGEVTFSTADSGTNVITLEAATTTSHGPDGTWSNSYAGQAVFSESSIATDYWTINGNGWSGSSCSGLAACGVDAAYNIYFLNATDGSGTALAIPSSTSHASTSVSLEYVDFQGTGTPTNWATQNGNSDNALNIPVTSAGTSYPVNDLYLGYSYLHDTGCDLIGVNGQSSTTQTNGSGHIYEHNFFARNWHGNEGSQYCHAQAISVCMTNWIVRYNVFFDTAEDGTIDVNVSNTCPISNWAIYGNTSEWDDNVPSGRAALTNGFLGFFGETVTGYIDVYNNTFVNIGGSNSGAFVNMYVMWIGGTASGSSASGASMNIYNNIFYNSGNSGGAGKAGDWVCDSTCTTETPNVGYNEGFCPSGGCTNGAGYTPQGSNDTNAANGNPFVNWDGSSNFNVALVADTTAGLAISGWSSAPSGCTANVNCMNVDPLGVLRGANGTIDRGALQVGGTAQIPAPPGTLSVVSVN